MKRILILGPGGSGKSTLSRRLGTNTGIPVIEIDKVFWQPGLSVQPPEEWIKVQRDLIAQDRWIIDGDLGPYDVVEERLHMADTIVFLDFSLLRCVWRVLQRSRERMDFWIWLLTYRWKSRPVLLQKIAQHAPQAKLHTLSNPAAIERFLALNAK